MQLLSQEICSDLYCAYSVADIWWHFLFCWQLCTSLKSRLLEWRCLICFVQPLSYPAHKVLFLLHSCISFPLWLLLFCTLLFSMPSLWSIFFFCQQLNLSLLIFFLIVQHYSRTFCCYLLWSCRQAKLVTVWFASSCHKRSNTQPFSLFVSLASMPGLWLLILTKFLVHWLKSKIFFILIATAKVN